jgi:hypothetical protein
MGKMLGRSEILLRPLSRAKKQIIPSMSKLILILGDQICLDNPALAHFDELSSNPRTSLMVTHVKKMSDDDKQRLLMQAERHLI